MELIDRYLQAVKFWLPKNQKQDIIAELSEDLGSQIEDREAELRRKLSESEVADLLKQRGRPVLVANRFLPQESLIGPVLFPIYLFVLKLVALFYMVPWILVWIGIAIFRPMIGIANTVFSAVNVFRPYWTVERAVFRLWSDAAGSALCWLMKVNVIAAISVVNVAPEKTARVAQAINWWAAKMFPWAVVFCVFLALSNVYRIIRVRSNTGPGARLNTAAAIR